MDIQHYRHLAEGTITLIGNSCQIKENISGLSGREKSQLMFYGLHCGRRYKGEKKDPPKRETNDIKGFSKKSRLRMLKKANRVDHNNKRNPYFITLTYPKKYPKEREEYKSDLDVFFKRLKRAYGNLEYLWRLEAQGRGAPHYHLLVYFEKRVHIKHLIEWVSQNWYEVAQRNWEIKYEEHRERGTNCRYVKEYRQVMYYISKYMAKEDDTRLKNQGRYWGASRGWEDFIAEDKLQGKELIVFRRLLSSYLKKINPYMARRVKRGGSIEIWAPKHFIINAYLWSKIACEDE